jgi:hypothetical protein
MRGGRGGAGAVKAVPFYAAAFLADLCSRDGEREARLRALAAEPLAPRIVALGACRLSGRVKTQAPPASKPAGVSKPAGSKSSATRPARTEARGTRAPPRPDDTDTAAVHAIKVAGSREVDLVDPGLVDDGDGSFGIDNALADDDIGADDDLASGGGTPPRAPRGRALLALSNDVGDTAARRAHLGGAHPLAAGAAGKLRAEVLRLRRYPFTLAYESFNASDWVTTAVVAPLLAGSVPVVWAHRASVLRVLPSPDAAVFAEDHADAAALAAFLWRTARDPAAMARHRAWRRDPAALARFAARIGDSRPTPCGLCALVAQARLESRLLARRRWRVWRDGEGWVEHTDEDADVQSII